MTTSTCYRTFPSVQLQSPSPSAHWTIVLAGGEGTRLSSLIRRWLGVHRPKQYCIFTGTRSMLQHTLDRAQRIANPGRTVVVIGPGHRALFEDALAYPFGGKLIEQPESRGTAVGILLPLMQILQQDPDATVTILPSDHFVHPEARFISYAHDASELASELNDKLILWGAVADRAETDYGWIQPGPPIAAPLPGKKPALFKVAGFHEKPARHSAENFYKSNWLWNTMILTAKAATLQARIAQCLPHLSQRFSLCRRLWTSEAAWGAEPAPILRQHYQDIEHADFSRHVLQRSVQHCMVLPMSKIQWCDWGRPERIMDTLDDLGIVPAFPADLAEEAVEVGLH